MSNFQILTPATGGAPNGQPQVWSAVTTDNTSTVSASGYLTDLTDKEGGYRMSDGDWLFITTSNGNLFGTCQISSGVATFDPFTEGSGSGTVTSVALAMPTIFSVSGSPVTTTGTLSTDLVVQTANQVWAGPASGAAAKPGFRGLVAADIPAGLPYAPSALANNHVFVGNGSGVATDVAMTGAVTIDNTGATSITNGAVTLLKLSAPVQLGIPYLISKPTAAGGAASQTFTSANCVPTDVIQVVVEASANPVQIQKVVPGNGTFDVFFTADPGAVTIAATSWHTV